MTRGTVGSLGKERHTSFVLKNVETTLHPNRKNYGLIIIPGKTPFPKKVKPVDPALLKARLKALQAQAQEGSSETYITSTTSERTSVVEDFLVKRKQLELDQYSMTKCGKDMRKVLHKEGESIPGVTKIFPPVSWPDQWKQLKERLAYLKEYNIKMESFYKEG